MEFGEEIWNSLFEKDIGGTGKTSSFHLMQIGLLPLMHFHSDWFYNNSTL